MTAEEINKKYITLPEIARECGQDLSEVHNWFNYYRYMEKEIILDRPVVSREVFERFKATHPELVKKEAVAA